MMEAATAAIIPWLGEWATVKIAEVLLGGVSSQLRARDLGKALKIAAEAADQQVRLFIHDSFLHFSIRYSRIWLLRSYKDHLEMKEFPESPI